LSNACWQKFREPDVSYSRSVLITVIRACPTAAGGGFKAAKNAGIRADKSHPYNLPNDPRHRQAVAEMQLLYQGQYYEGDGKPIIEGEESK
jgi:hypothetical protein